MKHQFPLLVASALTALFALNSRADDTTAPADPAPKHGPRGEGHGHRPLPPEILAQYDLDKDGKLNEAERAALKADIDAGKVTLPQGNPEDHGRPVDLIAKDLGVTPEQFRAAFKQVHPAAKGEQPTKEQREANRQALATALGVTLEKLDAVMDKYRPEGKGGHGPGGPGGPEGRGHRPEGGPLAKYDVNKDGQLDAAERAALKADIDSGAFPPAHPQPPQGGADSSAPAPDNAPTVIAPGPRR